MLFAASRSAGGAFSLCANVNKSLACTALDFAKPVPRRTRRAFAAVAMAGQKLISTDRAPAAVGAYSQAVKAGQNLYVSGQLGLIPGEKTLADGGVEAQTDQALKNMGEIFKEAGLSYDDVVKTTILLADISDFQKVNAVYAKYFTSGLPARACYAVKSLPLGGLVEIEAIAYTDA